MPKLLKDIQIHEVSAVDRGAGERVRVLLMKRDGKPLPKQENDAMPIEKKHEDFLAVLLAKHEKKVAKQAKRAEIEKAMLPSEQAFYQTLGKSDAKAFRKMSAAERAEIVKAGKFPPPKKKPAPADDDDDADKNMNKRIEDAASDTLAKALKSNEDLQKRIAKMEHDAALVIAKADARDLGLQETDAPMLMKARQGDVTAVADLEKALKMLKSQRDEAVRSGGIFKELGSAGPGGNKTALDELNALADQMRKNEPKLTPAQAFDKVVSDPANRELVKRESDERLAKVQKLAA